MLRELYGFHLFLLNTLFILGWHSVVFLVCIKMPHKVFNPSKERYLSKEWEHNGRFYRDKLKIHRWKDKVPQHIGKGGFSKQHLTGMSIEYLDEFMMETCRGEWFHMTNLFCVTVTLLNNLIVTGILFSFLVLVANVPFVMIQRYNRFRLVALRKKKIRDLCCDAASAQNIPAQDF